jgi:hypothetical protein
MNLEQFKEMMKEGRTKEIAETLKRWRENYAILSTEDFRNLTQIKSFLIKNGITLTDSMLAQLSVEEISRILDEAREKIDELKPVEISQQVEEIVVEDEYTVIDLEEEAEANVSSEDEISTINEPTEEGAEEVENEVPLDQQGEQVVQEEPEISQETSVEDFKSPVSIKESVIEAVEENRKVVKEETLNLKEFSVKIQRGKSFQFKLKRNGVVITIPSDWDLEIDDRVLEAIVEKYGLFTEVKERPISKPVEVVEKEPIKVEPIEISQGDTSSEELHKVEEEKVEPVDVSQADVEVVVKPEQKVSQEPQQEEKPRRGRRGRKPSGESSKKFTQVSNLFNKLLDVAYKSYKEGVPFAKLRHRVYTSMFNRGVVPEGYEHPKDATIDVLKMWANKLLEEGVSKEQLIEYVGKRTAKKIGLL